MAFKKYFHLIFLFLFNTFSRHTIRPFYYTNTIHNFLCVETFTRVSERHGRNDFYEHKMMMMTGNWDNKVCRNFDYYGVPLIGCKEMQFKKYPTCNLKPCFPGQVLWHPILAASLSTWHLTWEESILGFRYQQCASRYRNQRNRGGSEIYVGLLCYGNRNKPPPRGPLFSVWNILMHQV